MPYSCKILLDSVSEIGKRLTTFEVTFPRLVLAEAKTHRLLRGWPQNIEIDICDLGVNDDENLSRNSASSRAIPLLKQIERIMNDPFIPERFPLNCSGMQPQVWIENNDPDYLAHASRWLCKRDLLIQEAMKDLEDYNWHKQLVSRPLEVFMWHTAIITATEFDNFFKLRCDENAQYEIRKIADLMYEAYHSNKPFVMPNWGWHMPLMQEGDAELINDYMKHSANNEDGMFQERCKQVSVARCARVSYLTHDGKRDIAKDLELFERLRTSGHWSPFEHVATPYFQPIDHTDRQYEASQLQYENLRSGNFIGWQQYRKAFADENCSNFRKAL